MTSGIACMSPILLYRPHLMPVSVPDWLLARFDAIYKEPAHYEASYYGPINMLLTCYFSAADGFMVKPQARLRDPPTPGARTSIDSFGQDVGTHATDGNPDFLVSTGSAQLHSDVPLLIWEVKKPEVSDEDAAKQVDRYIEWAKRYQRNLAPEMKAVIWAMLVFGSKCRVFRLDPHSEFVYFHDGEQTTGDNVRQLLQSIRDKVVN